MLNPRLIPMLLLDGPGLVKTERFKGRTYIGDPCNTVRIFNEKQVDELILLDISCRRGRGIQFDRLRDIVSEAFMPLAYGGGIETVAQAERLLQIGIEKLVVRSAALERPDFVAELAKRFGSSTVVVCLDVVRRNGVLGLMGHRERMGAGENPVSFAIQMQEQGAGELVVQSVDREGTLAGYDLPLIRSVAEVVEVPVVAAGGAGSLEDLRDAVRVGGAAAAAAGAFFVFIGRLKAVLITYPAPEAVDGLFGGLQ
jgi:cyclase